MVPPARPLERLRIAGGAHPVRRWEIPRTGHPEGRSGYLRWRKALQKFHAGVCADILRDAGYLPEEIARVGAILGKRDLGRDDEVQVFEDALCLSFFETQLAAFAKDHPDRKPVASSRKRCEK